MPGGKSKLMLQRFIVNCLSDGTVWTNREIYDASLEHYKGGMKGFASWMACCSMIGQMSRFTATRISETHEVVKVGEGTERIKNYEGGITRERKYVEYILQER